MLKTQHAGLRRAVTMIRPLRAKWGLGTGENNEIARGRSLYKPGGGGRRRWEVGNIGKKWEVGGGRNLTTWGELGSMGHVGEVGGRWEVGDMGGGEKE